MRGVTVLIALLIIILFSCVALAEDCSAFNTCNSCFGQDGCFFCEGAGCLTDNELNRTQCSQLNQVVHDRCPIQESDCLAQSACQGCLTYNTPCYLNHTAGFDGHQFCHLYSSDGFSNAICNTSYDVLQVAMSNSLQTAETYDIEKSFSVVSYDISLTRGLLHVFKAFDGCQLFSDLHSNQQEGYYPDVTGFEVVVELRRSTAQLAATSTSNTGPSSGSTSFNENYAADLVWVSPNVTEFQFKFVTRCNWTTNAAPVTPSLYLYNHGGMLVAGTDFGGLALVVADMVAPLDDEKITVNIDIYTANAIKIEISMIAALLCTVLAVL